MFMFFFVFFFKTLENSELVKLNPNTTSENDMKQAFCRDFAKVQRYYEVNLFEIKGLF